MPTWRLLQRSVCPRRMASATKHIAPESRLSAAGRTRSFQGDPSQRCQRKPQPSQHARYWAEPNTGIYLTFRADRRSWRLRSQVPKSTRLRRARIVSFRKRFPNCEPIRRPEVDRAPRVDSISRRYEGGPHETTRSSMATPSRETEPSLDNTKRSRTVVPAVAGSVVLAEIQPSLVPSHH